MAKCGAEGELPQRRLGIKEQQNGELTDSELPVDDRKQRDREEREALVLWKKPLLTLHCFTLELLITLKGWICRLWQQRQTVFGLLILLILLSIAYRIEGAHQKYVCYMEKKTLWCAYWLGLGILSSVGLGTGLHTFLLYLGPHIASVTLAAYECGSVDFPEPPYPDQIVCPQQEAPASDSDSEQVGVEAVRSDTLQGKVSLWTIISKVRLEACMWGAGTAIGELPPYFMARAARLSGSGPDDDDYQEFEEMLDQTEPVQDFSSRAKVAVQKLIQKVGFFGILACASIPNPLFDLAGITCGHFLVPFWTFFGATLIGKAVIKMHIQKLFVIITFSKHIVEQMVSLIGRRTGCRGSLRRLWSSWYASLSAPLSTPWLRATPSANSRRSTRRARQSEGQLEIKSVHELQEPPDFSKRLPHLSSYLLFLLAAPPTVYLAKYEPPSGFSLVVLATWTSIYLCSKALLLVAISVIVLFKVGVCWSACKCCVVKAFMLVLLAAPEHVRSCWQ